ncbi:MAG: HAD-IIA family hydrolase [Roseiflexaceae bacterium]
MYQAYIFDLDGTIYLGDHILPGAVETLTALRAAGRRTIFLSNNPTHTRAQYARTLSAFGIPTTIDDIVTSSFALVQWLVANAPAARLFVIGEQPLQQELREAGLHFSRDPRQIDYVVASFDRSFDYPKLQIAFDAIRVGATLIATNPDRFCPVPGGGQPDAAAIIAAIEACTNTRCALVAGKPSPIMVETVAGMLGIPLSACIMIGDRLETDIAMGIAAGMATALVLTGDATRESLAASGMQPSYVFERIDQLLGI